MKEIFKVIKHHPMYSVSNFGRIFTHKQNKYLSPGKNSHGYHLVTLFNMGVRKQYYVHQLVANYFIEPTSRLKMPNHLNGIKTDNRASNLEVVSQKENVLHAHKLGLSKNGQDHWMSKLKYTHICKIRNLLKKGVSQVKIANKFRITQGHVSRIKRNVSWNYYKECYASHKEI